MSHHSTSCLAAAIAGAALLGATSADAAIVSLDFNEATDSATSPTQADFAAANVGQNTSTPLSFEIDGVTIRTDNAGSWGYPSNYTQSGARSRGALSEAAVSDFFRDFIFANDGHGRRFALVMEGLEADTAYQVTFWAYDHAASWQPSYGNQHTITVTQSGTPEVTGAITYTAGTVQPTSLEDNSVTLTATTDASGTLMFEVTGTDIAILNGVEVVIPEPASMSLLGAGAAMLLFRRRN